MKFVALTLISLLLLPCGEMLAQAGEQIVFKAAKVKVYLNDGTRLYGRIVGVAGDSLLLMEDHKAAAGCHVKFTYKNPRANLEGDVIAVDDSVLVMAVSEPPYRQNLLISNITNLELIHCRLDIDIQEFHGTYIGLSKIRSVWVKGNAVAGFIVGITVLPFLASVAYGVSYISPVLGGFLVVLAVFSPFIGVAIAGGKSYNIHGDRQKVYRLTKKLRKKYQPIPARPGW